MPSRLWPMRSGAPSADAPGPTEISVGRQASRPPASPTATTGTTTPRSPEKAASFSFGVTTRPRPTSTRWRLILEAQEAGARIAVIDPRSTDTTDAADLHLQPRPGTDGALALGLGHVIVAENRHAAAFLDEHALGFEAYRKRVAEYPPDRVAGITGLTPEEVRDLAIAYSGTSPALVIAGFGLQRHHRAGQAMRAVALLPALTGNVGIAGGGWQYANLASHCLREPPGLPGKVDVVERSFPTSRLGWALQNLTDPPLRAAWFEKANPVSQHPRTKEVRKGLAGLDLVVVVDQFFTDTAQMADFVLPAKTLFEEEDLVTAYWHPYLQLRSTYWIRPGECGPKRKYGGAFVAQFGFKTEAFDMDPVETPPGHAARGKGRSAGGTSGETPGPELTRRSGLGRRPIRNPIRESGILVRGSRSSVEG